MTTVGELRLPSHPLALPLRAGMRAAPTPLQQRIGLDSQTRVRLGLGLADRFGGGV